MKRRPKIGLILPVSGSTPPPEAGRMYPDVEFIARGLGLKTMNEAGYNSVVDDIERVAAELAMEGPDALTLIGTSLTFYRGAPRSMRRSWNASNASPVCLASA
jgi:arylmalonate decarboxylase